ncbi:MAG: hypothetical protein AAB410_02755 [Patescibacteria group bacterium]
MACWQGNAVKHSNYVEPPPPKKLTLGQLVQKLTLAKKLSFANGEKLPIGIFGDEQELLAVVIASLRSDGEWEVKEVEVVSPQIKAEVEGGTKGTTVRVNRSNQISAYNVLFNPHKLRFVTSRLHLDTCGPETLERL